MAYQTATNPETGERVALINGQWIPFSQSATNEQGEKAYLIGNQWITEKPKEESGFLRQAADVPLKAAQGVVQGVRMIADAFGAGSEASKTIRGAEDYLAGLMSAQSKNDSQEVARIMQNAEDAGVLDQVKAGLEAFSVAPVDMLAQGLGTAAPAVAAGLLTTFFGAPTAVGIGGSALIGSTMGAGVVKGTIYEETKKALLNAGVSKEQAEARAQLAQEYGGKNLDMILGGAALGGIASTTGIEKTLIAPAARNILGKAAATEAGKEVVKKGITRSIAEGALKEGTPELLQAGQEQMAANIAQQREGFDVPTMRGVVSSGVLEGLAGAGIGSAIEVPSAAYATGRDALKAQAKKQAETILQEERKAAEPETEVGPALKKAVQAEPEISIEDLERAAGIASPRTEPAFTAPAAEPVKEQKPEVQEPVAEVAPVQAVTTEQTAEELQQKFRRLAGMVGSMTNAYRDGAITNQEFDDYKAKLEAARQAAKASTDVSQLSAAKQEIVDLADKIEASGNKSFAEGMRLNARPEAKEPTPQVMEFYRSKLPAQEAPQEAAKPEPVSYGLPEFFADTPKDAERIAGLRKSGPNKVRIALDEINDTIQSLADTIAAAGYRMDQVIAGQVPPAILRIKSQIGTLAAGANRLSSSAEAVQKKYKRADPNRVKADIDAALSDIAKAEDLIAVQPNLPTAAEEMAGVEVPVSEEVQALQEQQKKAEQDMATLKRRGLSLWTALAGKLTGEEVRGLGGRNMQVGKNQFLNLAAKKGKPAVELPDMVADGALDDFLPPAMRHDSPQFDERDSTEYIRERLSSGQYTTHDTDMAVEAVGQQVLDIERRIQEELSLEEINREIQAAIDEQREADQAAADFASEGEAGVVEERQAEEATELDDLEKRAADAGVDVDNIREQAYYDTRGEEDAMYERTLADRLRGALDSQEQFLAMQTEKDLKAQDELRKAKEKAEQERKRADEEKAKADEAAADFVLTGSDRAADQAAARGQMELAPAEEPTREEQLAPVQKLAEKLLDKGTVRYEDVEYEGKLYQARTRTFEGKLFGSELRQVQDAIGNAKEVTLINQEDRVMTLQFTGKFVGEGRNVRIMDTQYVPNQEERPATYMKAIEAAGFKKVPRGSERAYKDVDGKEYTTLERNGVRIVLRSGTSLQTTDQGGVDVYQGDPNEWTIEALIVDPASRRKGLATEAMQEISDLASEYDIDLYLQPTPIDGGKMSKDDLANFYRQFDFKYQFGPLGKNAVMFRQAKRDGDQSLQTAEKGQIGYSPDAEEQRVEKELTGKTMLQAADWAIQNAPNAFLKVIAEKVRNRLRDLERRGVKLEFEVVGGDRRPRSLYDSRGYMQPTWGDDTKGTTLRLVLNGAAVMNNQAGYPPGTRYSTVLHELLHVATRGYLQFAPLSDPLRRQMRDLTNAIVDRFNTDAKAGKLPPVMQKYYKRLNNVLESDDEVLAWGLTDEEVQKYYADIKVGEKSAMTRLVELVRSVLGLGKPYESALDRLVKVSESMLDMDVSTIDAVLGNAGKRLGKAAPTTGEQQALFQREAVEFREDIPNERWLQEKIDYAQRSPRNEFGVPKMSSVTGYFKGPVMVPARWFKDVKGQRGEEKNVRQKDLEAIRKIIRDTGKFPLNEDGTEYVPYIEIGYDGKPWISEGNHRIMAAIAEGMEYIPIELRYFDGGQRRAGVWGPGNVASITENAAPAGKDILRQQEGRQNVLGQVTLGNWTEPTDTKLAGELGKDDIIYWLQDKMVDTKRIVESITSQVGKIANRWNPYLQEELYHGRTAKQTQDFLTKELRPLMQQMHNEGVTIGEFEQYLHNRHAEDYNAQVAKVNPNNPEMQDGGSGITNAEAREYLDNLSPEKRKQYESLAKKLDGITKGTRELLVSSGLENRETIDAWEKAFPDYVPLHREDVDFQYTTASTGTGQGFDVRGSFSRRAMGSKRKVVDILANVAMQRERAIVKANKNRVAEAVYGLAVQNANPDFWLAVNPLAEKMPEMALDELRAMGIDESAIEFLMKEPRQRAIDPKKNEVMSRINTMLRNNDNVLSMRFKGENRYVFFNPNNERAARAAKALKNLDADQLSRVMGMISKVTRWMASVNTQYNPIFGAYNFLRDVQGAALQLSDTPLAGKQKDVLKNSLPALKAIYSSLRKGEPADTEMGKLWNEFQEAGGQTGFRDMFSRSQERAEALQKEFRQMSEGKLKSAGRATLQWLSDYNDTMENAVRLSAYKVALENGMSRDEAASIAKNLTVNFNKKGQVATQMGALYAFFNAAVQGTARLVQTLKGPAGKKIMAGGLLLGAIQASLLAMAGFDEEEPPEFVRERNLIIPIGGKKYLTFPMPLGYHVIPGTSRIITEWALGGFKDTPDKLASLTGMYLEAFNPIGNAGWSVQSVAPTFADPFVALAENKDWTGKQIAREDFSNLDPTPGYTRAKDAATWYSTKLAEFLNFASGGTKYQPGVISPTPDQIDYLIGQATGGIGREAAKLATTIEKTATGEDLPPYKIPVVGRFYGTAESSAAESNRFYKNLEHINKLENEVKGRKENKEPIGDFLAKNPEARLAKRGRQIQEDIKKLKDRKEKLLDRKAPRESIKVVEEQIARKHKQFNDQVAALKK